MKRIILFLLLTLLTGCNEITQRVIENAVKEGRKNDSISEYQKDNPISRGDYKVLERKRSGTDSLFLVRLFLLSGKRYCDLWYRNQVKDGEGKFYYKNGQLSHIFTFKNDTIIGMTECYTPNGEKRPGPFAINGTGHIKIYHPLTYNLIAEYDIKNGLKNGNYSLWYENGNKSRVCRLINDTISGYFCSWYKSGIIDTERKEDTTSHTTYLITNYPTRKLKHTQAWKNGYIVASRDYDEKGRITDEENRTTTGELRGIKSFFGSGNQLLSKGHYLNGKKEGLYEYFYENGKKQATEMYSADTMLSETRWHDNGNLSVEGKYKGNLLHGTYREYYANGKLKLQQEYVMGSKHGKYVSYFDNGNLYNDGYFEDGKPKGDIKFYSRAGKYECTKNYK